MKKPIIDMHCDTICEALDGKHIRDMEGTHINLQKLKEGGSLVQCFALFIRTHRQLERRGWTYTPYEYYKLILKAFQDEMAANADLITQVRSYDEIMAGKDSGKLMALLTVEDAACVEGKLEHIDEFYNDGVRLMSLTWNYENCIAFPNSKDPMAHNTLGLKPFGFQAIEKMNDLGMIIDVAHLSERGFWDVLENTKKPIIDSHACARALCSHPRNLTDDQLKALGNNGGLIGINFCGGFLEDDNWTDSKIESVVKHMCHIADKAGVDSLGWGSDFDGIDEALEWKDAAGMPILVDALSKHFTDDELDKICYKNFLRVLKENE